MGWVVASLLLFWLIAVQWLGRRQYDAETSLPPEKCAEIFEASYGGFLWETTALDYEMRARPKGRMGAPVVGFNAEPTGDGMTRLAIWPMGTSQRYGMMMHAQLVARKAWSFKRRLRQADPSVVFGTSTPDPVF